MDIVLFITKQRSLFDYEDDNENRSASASLTTSIFPFSSPWGLRPRGTTRMRFAVSRTLPFLFRIQ